MTPVEVLVEGTKLLLEQFESDTDASGVTRESGWLRFHARLHRDAAETPLARLTLRFGLADFEIRCLLLAVAPHIRPGFGELMARRGGDILERAPTVALALDAFCANPDERILARRAFLASGPLVRHGLLTIGRPDSSSPDGLLAQRIDVGTATLRFLLGEEDLADTVGRYARLERPTVSLLNVIVAPEGLAQIRELAENHVRYREVISAWGFDRVLPYGRGLTLLFSGPPGTGKTLLSQAVAAHIGRPLLTLSATDLPVREGIEAALRDILAEARMRDAVLLVDECEALLAKDDPRRTATFRAIEQFDGILVLTTNHPDRLDDALERRIMYHMAFELPDITLRRQIWEVHLPAEVPLQSELDLDHLASTYDFAGGTIKNAILMAVNRALTRSPDVPTLTMADLEQGCTSQLRYALEDLTIRTVTHLRLKDIVLPDTSARRVREILAAIRNQSTVMNRWGFGRRLVTGKGIAVLFDGPPGTGKTLCAEIIAGEFNRPLYRVNLPEVVSKYVGETEKHIKAIFQHARISHAMLLFDEADSLFATRSSETKSATDRYANLEVNLLLQEIERFAGIVVLTTNFFGSLDKALLRRIQYRVTFEDPDSDQRRRIFETLTPPEAPLGPDVDFRTLAAEFELSGGLIKNVLLRAAYLACEAGEPLTQAILRDSCLEEYRAAGKVTREGAPRAARALASVTVGALPGKRPDPAGRH